METFGQKINPQQRLKGTDLGEGKKRIYGVCILRFH
jgi:hypothetical protein